MDGQDPKSDVHEPNSRLLTWENLQFCLAGQTPCREGNSGLTMDEYPSCSLDYCIPLAVIFGLPSKLTQATDLDAEYKEGAILIRSELPPVEEDQATPFLQHLKAADASGLSWNGRDTGCKHKFRFRTTGSVWHTTEIHTMRNMKS